MSEPSSEMDRVMITAGGIPVGIPRSTFVPEQRTKDAFVCFPENGAPWNWTARAYVLRDGYLVGPLWSGRDTEGPSIDTRWHPVGAGQDTEFLKQLMESDLKSMVVVEPVLEPGHYHPRIWRSGYLHSEREIATFPYARDTPYMNSFVSSIHRFDNLCRMLNQLFLAIYPGRGNMDAYGHEARNLMLLACTEVECQWRSVLEANHYPGTRFTTKDYVKLLGALRLGEYRVALRRYPEFPALSPFELWDPNAPTASLDWYDAYNHIKHDVENSLPKAKLSYAISAIAGVFALLVAQFGLPDVRDYLDDRTFILAKYPRWNPEHWYYEPLPRIPWVEVDYPF